MTKIFLIAGEASGDNLGAKLMSALKKKEKKIEFFGVGGEKMEKEGLHTIFPMHELSLLGFMEIIPHIPNLLNRINQTVEEILRAKPDVVVTIDAPAFNFRIAKKLQGSGIKLVHYVAPTVWAYKPKRAKKIAKLYDHLLLLLPFEPPYFEEVGLPCTFIGHPIFEENLKADGKNSFRKKHKISASAPLLSIFPGSRRSELNRHLPVFEETVELLKHDFEDLKVVIISTEKFKKDIELETRAWASKPVVVSNAKDKKEALAESSIALAKSGTVTLEVAIAGVPMVVAYKVNPMSAWLLRRMIKVEFVTIINLIEGEEVIKELLQEECAPNMLASQIKALLDDEEERKKQLKQVKSALKKMGQGKKPTPSEKAAETILKLIK